MYMYFFFEQISQIALFLIVSFFYFTTLQSLEFLGWIVLYFGYVSESFLFFPSSPSDDGNHILEDSDAMVVILYKEGKLR